MYSTETNYISLCFFFSLQMYFFVYETKQSIGTRNMRCFLFSLDLVAFIVVDHHCASKKERQAEPCLRSANRRFAFISPYTRVHLHTMPKSLCLSFYYSSLESFISWPFQKELFFFLPASVLCYNADKTKFSLKMVY